MEASIINFFARRGALVLVDQNTGKIAIVPSTGFAFCPEDLVNAIEADREWAKHQEDLHNTQ